jgi:DNA-binding response OmpR family regulator
MHVLLIVDYAPAVRGLKLGLEEEGFTVDLARNEDEGYDKSWQVDYDVIILDLMVLLGGLSLLQKWRQAGLTTPVMALAAPERCEDKIRSLEWGADDCLTKPFDFEELLARLRALTRRNGLLEEPVLRVGDLEINTAVRSVKRSGRSIYLTPREFSLLQFLAAHKGKVVSRSMIRENLYNDTQENTSNVVDVYIRYLRKKIDKGFTRPLILTRWGQGYLLRGEESPI